MEGIKAPIYRGFFDSSVDMFDHYCFNRLVKINLRNILIFLIIGISIFIRVYRMGLPAEIVFDEVYFPTFAHHYLTGTDFYDSHPPLGKLIIAGSIAVAGNNPFGWRLSNVLVGMGLIFITTLFMYTATKRVLPTLLTFILLSIDPMILIESRIGLINIFMLFFAISGMWCYWLWLKHPKVLTWYILALLFFGAAGAVKWIGFGPLLASILFTLILKLSKRYTIPIRFKHQILLLILPGLVYLVSFLPDLLMRHQFNFDEWWDYLKWWHTNSFKYHANLDATHPYGSQWWSWPLSLRPLWLYYKSVDSNMIIGIFEPGNVITWIGGLVSLCWACLKLITIPQNRPHPFLLFLLLMYFVTYLPWAFIGRVKFIYHYFLPLIALHLIFALALESLYKKPSGKQLVAGVLIAGTTVFMLYLPLFIGQPIPTWYYQKLMFIKGWI